MSPEHAIYSKIRARQYAEMAEEMYREIRTDDVRFYAFGTGALPGTRRLIHWWERIVGPGARDTLVRVPLEQPKSRAEELAIRERGYRLSGMPRIEGRAKNAVLVDNSVRRGDALRGAVVWCMENAERLGVERIWTAIVGMDELNVSHFKIYHGDRPYQPLVPDNLQQKAARVYGRFEEEARRARNGEKGHWLPVFGSPAPLDRLALYAAPIKDEGGGESPMKWAHKRFEDAEAV